MSPRSAEESPLWTPEEMAELLEMLALSADRHTNSYQETAHICRHAAKLIRHMATQHP